MRFDWRGGRSGGRTRAGADARSHSTKRVVSMVSTVSIASGVNAIDIFSIDNVDSIDLFILRKRIFESVGASMGESVGATVGCWAGATV